MDERANDVAKTDEGWQRTLTPEQYNCMNGIALAFEPKG